MEENNLRVALITDEMSPLVSCLINSKFDIVGVAGFDGPDINQNPKVTSISKILLQPLLNTILTPTISDYCKAKKIDYCILSRDKVKQLIEFINFVKPDVIVLYCVPLLPSALFDIATKYTINIHPSLLPLYRGADPSTHMFLDDFKLGGVTIHIVDDGEDTGDILLQEPIEIKNGITRNQYIRRAIYEIGAPLLLKALSLIASAEEKPIKQSIQTTMTRSRRLTNNQIFEQINWQNWSLERTWATLYFFQERKDFLPAKKNWQRASVRKTFVEQRCFDSKAYGQFIQTDSYGYYCHPRGRIYIDYKFSIKKFIKIIYYRLFSLETAAS